MTRYVTSASEGPPDPVTDEEFQEARDELLDELEASVILDVPGVYELVVENYNNQIIEKAQENREAKLDRIMDGQDNDR